MMPKPTDREKKICPYAATHTEESPRADQDGVNRASRPAEAPGRVRAMPTMMRNMTTSSGISTTLSLPMPFCTPSISTTSSTSHAMAVAMNTGQMKSKPIVTCSETFM